MKTYIIAEAACTWLHAGIAGAIESIKAAKEAGADAWKTQWTSDPKAMAKRRKMPKADYASLAWPTCWHPVMAAECARLGFEYMCTVFLPGDVEVVAPHVSKGKVSAFEAKDAALLNAWESTSRRMIVSLREMRKAETYWGRLWCVSEYPTLLERLKLPRYLGEEYLYNGISDHTTSTLTGAVAVGAGAKIIERHFRTWSTPQEDPDYAHSLTEHQFRRYVQNVRDAERMMYG